MAVLEARSACEKDLPVSIWILYLEFPERASLFESHLAQAAKTAGIDQLKDLALIRPNLYYAEQMRRGNWIQNDKNNTTESTKDTK